MNSSRKRRNEEGKLREAKGRERENQKQNPREFVCLTKHGKDSRLERRTITIGVGGSEVTEDLGYCPLCKRYYNSNGREIDVSEMVLQKVEEITTKSSTKEVPNFYFNLK